MSNYKYLFSPDFRSLRDDWLTIGLLRYRLQVWPKILCFHSKIDILVYIFICARKFQAGQNFPAFYDLPVSFLCDGSQTAGQDSDLASSVLEVCIQPSHLAREFCKCPQILLSYRRSQPFQKGLPDIADSCWNYIWPSLISASPAENKVLEKKRKKKQQLFRYWSLKTLSGCSELILC